MKNAKKLKPYSVDLSTAPPTLREVQLALASGFKGVTQDSKFDAVSFIKGDQHDRGFRLGLYKEAANLKYTRLISASFEATFSFLTARRRREVTDLYAEMHAPSTYSAVDALEHFPEFVRALPESGRFQFLHELAYFEWRLAVANFTVAGEIIRSRSGAYGLLNSHDLFVSNWTLSISGSLLERSNVQYLKSRRQRLVVVVTEESAFVTELREIDAQVLVDTFPANAFTERLSASLGRRKSSTRSALETQRSLKRLVNSGVCTLLD